MDVTPIESVSFMKVFDNRRFCQFGLCHDLLLNPFRMTSVGRGSGGSFGFRLLGGGSHQTIVPTTQTGLGAIGGVPVDRTLGCRGIHQLERKRQRGGSLLIVSGYHCSLELLAGSAHGTFRRAIAQSANGILALSLLSRPISHVLPPNTFLIRMFFSMKDFYSQPRMADGLTKYHRQ
jgi:hypothetical protein